MLLEKAEDGIRDLGRSRGIGDEYERQEQIQVKISIYDMMGHEVKSITCLLYTSDAADDLHCVVLGRRRILQNQRQTLHRSRASP